MSKFWLANYPQTMIQFSTKYQSVTGGSGLDWGSEASAQLRIRDTYTWANLYARVLTNGITVTTAVKGRVNGADGNQALSIGASATGEFEDTTHSDSLVTGDLINYQLSAAAGGATMVLAAVASLLEHSGTITVQGLVAGGQNQDGVTRYLSVGPGVVAQTEANAQITCRRATTLSRLRFYVSANAATGTSTVTCRVNGADGNQALSVTASATGEFEDTSNSDSVVDGDAVCTRVVAGGSGVLTYTALHYESSNGLLLSSIGLGGAGTLYRSLGAGRASSTESDVQIPARSANLAFANYATRVYSNSRSIGTTHGLRKNGATAISVSVPASTTGYFEETSTTVTAAATTDDFNFIEASGGGGTGSISIALHAVTQYAVVPVTVAGATAGAPAAALTGAVQIARAVPGEAAGAVAAANAGTVATVQIATIAGATATAAGAAGAGVVATFPAAIVVGVAATAAAAALAGTVATVGIVAVAGASATAPAAAGAGAVQVARTVPGEPAAAAAAALMAVVTALRLGHPHPPLPAPSVGIDHRLSAPRVHARRSGSV